MHQFDITIIGGGAMGSALVAGILKNEFIDATRITVCDPSNDSLKRLATQHKIKTSCDTDKNIAHAEWIILAVKPQVMSEVLKSIKPHLNPDQIVISIAAGVALTTMVKALAHDRVVRIMPNTPAQVGCGMSAWIATEGITDGDKQLIREFLKSLGEEIELRSDDEIDKATAIHGSGPGYIFYMLEALQQAGIDLGFSRDIATKLAVQTLYGSGVLARESGTEPAKLREQVTSKGGGTEAALNVLNDEHVREDFIKAVQAAYTRYQELAQQ